MKALFLDDERTLDMVTWVSLPEYSYDIVRSFDEFIEYISLNGIPSFITFDNDLGDNLPEGKDCVKWLIEQVLDGKQVFPNDFMFDVHSMNPPAAIYIQQLLSSFLEKTGHPNW